jgi:hypothetical protein
MKTCIAILCLVLTGCAVVPRGPITSHSVERFQGRSDGLVAREIWKDAAFTRGIYVFTDPKLTTVTAWQTNQTALGGCSHFQCGELSIIVDSNLVPAITATGTAVGNVVGAAAKTAVGKP